MSKYRCLHPYSDEEYGVDFIVGKVYEHNDEYMHSTENGSDVMMDEEELAQNWFEVGIIVGTMFRLIMTVQQVRC